MPDVPIDHAFIGYRLPAFEVTVDAERVRKFAAAIGEHEVGVRPPPVPPTYLKVIEGEGNSSRVILSALGVDLRRVLHVEQEFEYQLPIRPGDRLTVERTVSDIYDRKEGALEFIVIDTAIRNSEGDRAGYSRQWILVRNRSVARSA